MFSYTTSYACTSKGLLARAWLAMSSGNFLDTFTMPNFGINPEDTDLPENIRTYFAGDYRMDVLYLNDINNLPNEYPNTDKYDVLDTLSMLDDYTKNGAAIRISFWQSDYEFYIHTYFGMRDNQIYCTTMDLSPLLPNDADIVFDGVNSKYNKEIKNSYYKDGTLKSTVYESWSTKEQMHIPNGEAIFYSKDGVIEKTEIYEWGTLIETRNRP